MLEKEGLRGWTGKTHENVFEVLGRSPVRVGRLDDSDLEIQPSVLDELDEESCDESGNLVAVEEVERSCRIGIVEDDSVRVAIEAAVALARDERGARRSLLLRLDVVSAGLVVERAKSRSVVASDVEREDVRADRGEELLELGSTDAVGAVDREGRRRCRATFLF